MPETASEGHPDYDRSRTPVGQMGGALTYIIPHHLKHWMLEGTEYCHTKYRISCIQTDSDSCVAYNTGCQISIVSTQ